MIRAESSTKSKRRRFSRSCHLQTFARAENLSRWSTVYSRLFGGPPRSVRRMSVKMLISLQSRRTSCERFGVPRGVEDTAVRRRADGKPALRRLHELNEDNVFGGNLGVDGLRIWWDSDWSR